MRTDWFMVMGMGYSANVRMAVTARVSEEEGIDTLYDILRNDPDAERAHLLRSQVTEYGLRKWMPIKTIRRARDGELLEQGPLK